MKRLVCITFFTIILSFLSRTEGIRLHLPTDSVQKLFKDPGIVISKRIDIGDEPIVERNLPEDLWCDDSNVIDRFTSKFTNTILSDGLSELYGTSLPPEEAGATYYRIVLNAVDNVHTCYPRSVSQIVSDAIRQTFGNLTTTGHIQSYGNTVATYMKSRKVLTCENLNELCDAYISYVKQAAWSVPRIEDRRNANIQAVSDSLVHFLSSLDLYKAGTVRTISQDYANYLHLITGVPQSDSFFINIDATLDVEK